MHKSLREQYPYMFKDKNDDSGYETAWEKARMAAKILKTNYGAKKVFVFGSLLEKALFDKHSDIDLAVEGIPESMFYRAVGEITEMIDSFNIDIIDYGNCKSFLYDDIEKKGLQI